MYQIKSKSKNFIPDRLVKHFSLKCDSIRNFRKPSHFRLKIFFRPFFTKIVPFACVEFAWKRAKVRSKDLMRQFSAKKSTFLQLLLCEISPYFCGKWRYLRFPQVSRGFKMCRNSAIYRKSKGIFHIKTAVKNSKFFPQKLTH